MTEPAIAEPPAPPPPPPTPEQMPAQVPNVSYQGGMLTIDAQNSNLSDILAAVHKATGADIDITGTPGTERVASKVGPGPARDVMSQLLAGSKFDYVMVSSAVDPSGIERIILTPRSAKAPSGPIGGGGPPVSAGNKPPAVVADDDDSDHAAEEPPPPPVNPTPPQVAQPGAPNQPGVVPPGVQPGYQVQPGTGVQPAVPGTAPQAEGSDQQQQPQVRTPEQMLQELQRIQQLQQQQQQLQQQQQQR